MVQIFFESGQATEHCPTCSNIPTYMFSKADTTENCMYRYDKSDLLYCLTDSGYQASLTHSQMIEDTFVVAAGTYQQGVDINSAAIYKSDGSLTTLPDLPFSGDDIKGGISGDRVVLCSTTQCYSWSSASPQTWTSALVTGSYKSATAVTTDSGVWFSGGFQSPSNFTEEKYTFLIHVDKVGTATLSKSVDLTTPRFYHCAIENGDSPILTGGINMESEYFSLVEMYNLPTGRVTSLPNMIFPRINHGCTRFKSDVEDFAYSLIIAGGWHKAEYTKHVEILTPGAQEWVLAEELPTYRLFTAMTTLGDKPFLIGGGEVTDSGWIYHDSILMYNTSSMAFQDTGMTLTPGRRGMAVIKMTASYNP